MFTTWVLHAIALVAAASAAGAKYDPLNDLAAFPAFRQGLLRYRQHHWGRHQHLRGHRPHKMALTHHYGVVAPRLTWSPDGTEVKPPADIPTMALPGRHPSVEKVLDGMGGDLQALKERQLAAKETRGQLEGKVAETMKHMNDAVSIKRAINHKEAEILKEQNRLMSLEREAKHIEETHASLVNSLHRVLEPKLMFARDRLRKKAMVFDREQQVAKGWEQKRDQLHDHAIEMLKEKKVAHAGLLEAEQQVAQAKRAEGVARIKYEHERQRVGDEIQSFRYSETRLKAEVAHEKSAEEAALAAKESVSKLAKVLEVESEKVEESSEVSKNRVHHKMQEIEASRERSRTELESLRQRYREWQDSQRERAAEVVRKSQDTAVAAQAYADRQKQVLDSAQKEVARAAESRSDWAGETWANDGFTDALPSFSSA